MSDPSFGQRVPITCIGVATTPASAATAGNRQTGAVLVVFFDQKPHLEVALGAAGGGLRRRRGPRRVHSAPHAYYLESLDPSHNYLALFSHA